MPQALRRILAAAARGGAGGGVLPSASAGSRAGLPAAERRPRAYHAGQPTPETHPHLLKPGEVTPGITGAELRERRAGLLAKLPPGSVAVIAAAEPQYLAGVIPHIFRQARDQCGLRGKPH